jgi:hypothetical protein
MDSDYTGGSSASYTGGSDTTGSTGDSGFGGDTNPFLKVSIGGRHNPKKPTGKLYYKRLGTPDDVDCYTNVAKGDPQENLYEEPMKKDAIYMNVREAADEYMNTQRST